MTIQHLNNPRGYAMERWQSFLENQFHPRCFYEIGANNPFIAEGQLWLKRLMPDTKFYLVEACRKHEQALRDSREEYAIAVLGERDGEQKTFYQSAAFPMGTGDSLCIEQTDFYNSVNRIETQVVTTRLDTLIAREGWPQPDFIRIDTQGSELDILRGAPVALRNARAVYMECNAKEYNRGAPSLAQSVRFMDESGFRVYDVGQFHHSNKHELVQLDLFFLREP